jgi:hypothetical protein
MSRRKRMNVDAAVASASANAAADDDILKTCVS